MSWYDIVSDFSSAEHTHPDFKSFVHILLVSFFFCISSPEKNFLLSSELCVCPIHGFHQPGSMQNATINSSWKHCRFCSSRWFHWERPSCLYCIHDEFLMTLFSVLWPYCCCRPYQQHTHTQPILIIYKSASIVGFQRQPFTSTFYILYICQFLHKSYFIIIAKVPFHFSKYNEDAIDIRPKAIELHTNRWSLPGSARVGKAGMHPLTWPQRMHNRLALSFC